WLLVATERNLHFRSAALPATDPSTRVCYVAHRQRRPLPLHAHHGAQSAAGFAIPLFRALEGFGLSVRIKRSAPGVCPLWAKRRVQYAICQARQIATSRDVSRARCRGVVAAEPLYAALRALSSARERTIRVRSEERRGG